AQARRQDLERLALRSLTRRVLGVGASPDDGGLVLGVGSLSPTPNTQHPTPDSLITPVVRVSPESDVAGEVRHFLEGEIGALLLLPLRRMAPGECPWLRRALRKPLPCAVAWARQGSGIKGMSDSGGRPGIRGQGPGIGISETDPRSLTPD